jgi:DNA adenine methylase
VNTKGKNSQIADSQGVLPLACHCHITPKERIARPFIKWVGGKGQLLSQFSRLYPNALLRGDIHTYVEPFLGGGAVFFDVIQKYKISDAHLCDINQEVVLLYRVVQSSPGLLIDRLVSLSDEYLQYDYAGQEAMYYRIRQEFNDARSNEEWRSISSQAPISIVIASDLMFLNRTCFNGLFRLNRKGEFNVPFGKYKKPRIVDKENIVAASQVLQPVTIHCASYESCRQFIGERPAFVYFDPPYRPLSKTAQFTSYSRTGFTEDDQKQLASFFRSLADKEMTYLMLSNSDPGHFSPEDTFFEDQFPGFVISRVSALRNINSKGSGRGAINEVVITNYPVQKIETKLP